MSNDTTKEVIGGFFLLANTVLTILLTARLNKVHKQINGMQDNYIEAVKGKGEAEGNLKGRLDQTAENKVKK